MDNLGKTIVQKLTDFTESQPFLDRLKECVNGQGFSHGRLKLDINGEGEITNWSFGTDENPAPPLTLRDAMKDAVYPVREKSVPPPEVAEAEEACERARKSAEVAQNEWISAIAEGRKQRQRMGEQAYNDAVNFNPANPHGEVSSTDRRKDAQLQAKIEELFKAKEAAWEEAGAAQREFNALNHAWRLELLHQKLIQERNEAERKRAERFAEQERRRASLINRLRNRFLQEANKQ